MAIAVDRETNRPVSGQNLNQNNQSFNQSQSTSPQTVTGTTNQTQKSAESGNVYSSSYSLNTTPEAREALNNLIGQLSDKNNITKAEADAQFPMAVGRYSRESGWITVNPITGASMSPEEANRFNAEQMAKQQKFVAEGGVSRGGTADQRDITDARLLEIQRNRETQGDYSKDAAFADAKSLTDYFTRVLSEQQMPGILRAAEGAGASQSTVRALLTNDAVARASEGAAKVGTEISAQYGNINVGLANVLEELTRQDPNSISNQLLEALNIAKGIEQTGSQGQVSNKTGVTNTTGTTVQNTGGKVEDTNRQYQQPVNNAGATPAVTPSAYTPAASAGTGYIIAHQAEPFKEVGFTNYGSGDTEVFFDDSDE